MNIDYKELMAGKTIEELYIYINEPSKYKEEAINAAIQELKNRGIELDEQTIAKISVAIENTRNRDTSIEYSMSNNESNIVAGLDAPELYSLKAVRLFSIIFAPLAGALMLTSNLKKVRQDKIYYPLLFGIFYLFLTIAIQSYITSINGTGPQGVIIINLIGAAVLEYYFWNKLIGVKVLYRKRSVVLPLIIWTFISIFFISIIFLTGTSN